MKFFFIFCFIFVLAKFTEQQAVVLDSKKISKVEDKSYEMTQLVGSIEDTKVEDAYEPSGEQKVEAAESGTEQESVTKKESTEEEKGNDNNSVQETNQKPGDANNRGHIKGNEESDDNAPDATTSTVIPNHSDISGEVDPQFIFIKIPNEVPKNGKPVKIGVDGDERTPHWNRWLSEIAAGNNAEIMGTNPDIYQPDAYPHLSRRFVPQYPYTEEAQNVMVAPDKEIVPIQAPLEVVKKVLEKSALEEAAKPQDNTQDLIRKKILRTGDYWNAVWVEEMDPKSALRMSQDPVLGVIKAKIKPGSEFYNMVLGMKKISPRLLYIINDKEK